MAKLGRESGDGENARPRYRRRTPPSDARPFSETEAARIAHIVGPTSAAAQALADMEMCRKNGIECLLMYSARNHSFFVFYAEDQLN